MLPINTSPYHFPFLLQKSLFLDNTITTHLLHHTITPSYTYSLFPSILRKCLYFSAHKHIPISFSISLTKSLLLERNITHSHNTKVIPAATIISCICYNLSLISFILPYILQTHSSQNIHTYFSYIFKLYVSQSNYIQDPYSTKYLHIFLIHLTNTLSHKAYIFLTIFIYLKRYQILFQEHVTEPFSWKAYNYNAKKSL